MPRPRIHRSIPLLCAALLSASSTLATAAHVPPVVPLTSFSNHSHEKHTNSFFPVADLSFIDLSFADLTNCAFQAGTNLSNADFTGADLSFANLSGCNIDGANFRGANLTNANLPCTGNADFRGAILTGVIMPPPPCGPCNSVGPNAKDQCTVGDPPALCLLTAPFRGLISGVVYTDSNLNGQLDLGEPGIAGVTVNVTTAGGPLFDVTDSRGAYHVFATVVGPATTTLQTVTLPPGMILDGSAIQGFDVTQCRSGHGHNYKAFTPATPAQRSTFGRIKSLYR
jgi:uncharacterized protein YjbI with pentapeptide repeats